MCPAWPSERHLRQSGSLAWCPGQRVHSLGQWWRDVWPVQAAAGVWRSGQWHSVMWQMGLRQGPVQKHLCHGRKGWRGQIECIRYSKHTEEKIYRAKTLWRGNNSRDTKDATDLFDIKKIPRMLQHYAMHAAVSLYKSLLSLATSKSLSDFKSFRPGTQTKFVIPKTTQKIQSYFHKELRSIMYKGGFL